jgi:hypothetical protein
MAAVMVTEHSEPSNIEMLEYLQQPNSHPMASSDMIIAGRDGV